MPRHSYHERDYAFGQVMLKLRSSIGLTQAGLATLLGVCRLGQVIEGPIPFFALCEHHALPFFGHAHIGYLPHQSIIGISKLTRLVRLFAKRFTVQERLGEQIVNTFDAMLEPHGVAVYLQAHHLCVEMRGVRDTSPLTQTTVWRGEYEHNPSLRVEFLLACGAER